MSFNLSTGGKVRGVGADIVDCKRIEKTLQRQGEVFLKKVFTTEEIEYCMKMKRPATFLAARFAAKEAVSKAFSTGIGGELDWKSISVKKGRRDEPYIVLDKKGKSLLKSLGCTEVLISLSHTDEQALAFAVLVSNND